MYKKNLSICQQVNRLKQYDVRYKYISVCIFEYYLSIKNIPSFLATWMKLEGIMLSEMSEKDKFHMISSRTLLPPPPGPRWTTTHVAARPAPTPRGGARGAEPRWAWVPAERNAFWASCASQKPPFRPNASTPQLFSGRRLKKARVRLAKLEWVLAA